MKIYIDTNTFPASPAIYADAEKTKALPRILPAVELQRGGFEVAFLGRNQPQDIATVSLAASIEGTQTQVIAELGRESETEEAWQFDFALSAEALVAEIAKHGSARLRVGVIVEDDTERREWQLVAMVYPSASGETDPKQVESAKNFAELAEQAAKRAQEAQADVAGNTQLAESAKQTATQAANAAIEAADNAEVYERNAAESKGAAEQAKADAEAAKTAAQKAASDAQETLSNVYTKSEIDGISTGAEVVVKMNEIIAQLKDYEEVTGEKLPFDFWEAVMAEFQRWQENPNEVKEWVTEIKSDNSITSSCPYYNTPTNRPIVDFSVTRFNGYTNRGIGTCLHKDIDVIIFVPEAVSISSVCANHSTMTSPVIVPSATNIYYAFYKAKNFDNAVIARKCVIATNAFEGAKMSAKNIAITLDSFPLKVGTQYTSVSFAGCPGAVHVSTTEAITVEVDGHIYTFDNFPKFVTDDENETLRYAVARAAAKGWTVQMGNPAGSIVKPTAQERSFNHGNV